MDGTEAGFPGAPGLPAHLLAGFENRWKLFAATLLSMVCWPPDGGAQSASPRIVRVIDVTDLGEVPEGAGDRLCHIDRGLESTINMGDTLNVYREKRLAGPGSQPLRVFVGTLVITDAQQGSAVGSFEANGSILGAAPLTGDFATLRVVLDAEVLFDAKSNSGFKPGAAKEFDKWQNSSNLTHSRSSSSKCVMRSTMSGCRSAGRMR